MQSDSGWIPALKVVVGSDTTQCAPASELTPTDSTPQAPTTKASGPQTPATKAPGPQTPATKAPVTQTPATKAPVSRVPTIKAPVSRAATTKTSGGREPVQRTKSNRTAAPRTAVNRKPVQRTAANRQPAQPSPIPLPTLAPRTSADRSITAPKKLRVTPKTKGGSSPAPAVLPAPVDVPSPRRPVRAPSALTPPQPSAPPLAALLVAESLVKRFVVTLAVAEANLSVRSGTIVGIVGPQGSGKTTFLSMVAGLLRPDAGRVLVNGIDVWGDPASAKTKIGVVPHRLRLFDRLTGAQLLYYAGVLQGLDRKTSKSRSADLSRAFGFDDALSALVADYPTETMTKIALAAAMIHAPQLLVLDEPFDAFETLSTATVMAVLKKYVASGGAVVVSSQNMDFVQRYCDSVAIMLGGRFVVCGSLTEVCGETPLADRYAELVSQRTASEGLTWLYSSSD